jgi:hypothetical protein
VTSRGSPSVFAGYRFLQELIAVAVRWYLRYSLSVQHKCSSIRHKEPREGYSGFGLTAKVELLFAGQPLRNQYCTGSTRVRGLGRVSVCWDRRRRGHRGDGSSDSVAASPVRPSSARLSADHAPNLATADQRGWLGFGHQPSRARPSITDFRAEATPGWLLRFHDPNRHGTAGRNCPGREPSAQVS